MINSIAFGSLRAKRPIIGATVLWLLLGFSGAVSATPTDPASLGELFHGPTKTFTRDGLVFSNFAPVLAKTFPAGQDLANLIIMNPLVLLNAQFLDFTQGDFSHGWGNAKVADPDNIGLVVLDNNAATAGVDPGFRLNSATEWTVTAGTIASGQLSAFAYDVKKTGVAKINSADIKQISTIDAVGPDIFSPSSFELPDVAGGFALQFIMDLNSNDILSAILNVTGDLGVRLSPTEVKRSSQFDSWSGFTDRDAIRVVNVIGVGASSGGGFTMNALEQRIDPPSPQIPQPGTLLLISIGLVGLGCLRRRSSATSESSS